ncbi:MAG TPA: response regulator transcription factor [Alphaproteobacteria bacterium]|nr:response regulator transcription factor [Alphaproteobacteria bacterium]HOO51172.1 response regulator transcription factor [Alphaproteobacteria bacterium]
MHLLIADDHTMFRDAMSQYLTRSNPDAQIKTTKNLEEALQYMEETETKPDLVLLDLNMPGMNGLEGFKKFRDNYPDTSVALLSGVAEIADVQQAMDLGAIGYFPKTLSGRAMLKAIELVLSGEKFIPVDHATNGLMPSYFSDHNKNDPTAPLPMHTRAPKDPPKTDIRLTPREEEVLERLGKGMSNKDIARDLDLQEVTIKLHIRGICRKLDSSNRTQAALKAYELGLIKKVE